MNAAITEMTHYPDPETLAAFVDGRLNAAQRQEVMKHMAECAECRDNVLLSTEIVAMEAPVTNVVRPPFGMKKILSFVATAAAVLVALLAIPSVWERVSSRPTRIVVEVVTESPKRPTDARVSFAAEYKQAKPVYRSGADSSDSGYSNVDLLADKARAAAEKNPTAENLHAFGVVLMYAGERQEAVKTLQSAETASGRSPSAALLNDLAAAYIGNANYNEALEAATQSWQIEQTPVAAWNRALALGSLLDPRAKEAWETYLKVDPTSEWAKEVRERHLTNFN
jgi:anti-sigma factor RsiW